MTTLKLPTPMVSIDWLAAHLRHPKLVVLDTDFCAIGGINPSTDQTLQIPGTQIFDFDKRVCDLTSNLPHMMPTPEHFTQEVQRLGISTDSIIVIYDRTGVYSSPRAWLMFKAMGHDAVAVLEGGMPAWLAAEQPCEPVGSKSISSGNFTAKPRPQLFCDAEYVMKALTDKHYVVLDARTEGRFKGTAPEPRPALRAGHMPGAVNLPFKEVQVGYGIRPIPELRAILATKANYQQKLIMSCGSSVTTCILALAATLAGYAILLFMMAHGASGGCLVSGQLWKVEGSDK